MAIIGQTIDSMRHIEPILNTGGFNERLFPKEIVQTLQEILGTLHQWQKQCAQNIHLRPKFSDVREEILPQGMELFRYTEDRDGQEVYTQVFIDITRIRNGIIRFAMNQVFRSENGNPSIEETLTLHGNLGQYDFKAETAHPKAILEQVDRPAGLPVVVTEETARRTGLGGIFNNHLPERITALDRKSLGDILTRFHDALTMAISKRLEETSRPPSHGGEDEDDCDLPHDERPRKDDEPSNPDCHV